MKRLVIAFVAVTALASAQMGQRGAGCCMGGPAGSAPIAKSPVVELSGTIEKVQIAPGQGMPYLEVKTAKGTTRVYLGSMRYLMEENFNPKSGQEVAVKGYQVNDAVVASQVSLPAEKKTLKLRDSNGWPLWRGGPRGPMRRQSPPASSTQQP